MHQKSTRLKSSFSIDPLNPPRDYSRYFLFPIEFVWAKQFAMGMELPGHGSGKTMEIYTHVSTKSLAKIKSRLDLILKEQL
jgi:hypothetical protein